MLQEATKTKAAPQELGLFSAVNGQDRRRAEAWFNAMRKKAEASKDYVSETVKCTPAMAEFLLTKNRNNRPLSQARVQDYLNVIKDGRWKRSSQGISVNTEGYLNNGQHRLTAICLAGQTVPLYVTFGEEPDVFDVLDTGKIRGNADVVGIKGYKNYNVLAAACRVLRYIEVDRDFRRKAIGNDEIIAFIANHPGLDDATTYGNRIAQRFRVGAGAPSVACYFILRDSRQPEQLETFLDRLSDGAGLPKRSPILALRELYMTRTLDIQVRGSGDKSWIVAASIIKTWNLWITGSRGSVVRAMISEAFPKVI